MGTCDLRYSEGNCSGLLNLSGTESYVPGTVWIACHQGQKQASRVQIALLLVLFAMLILGARENSITADEPSHLASGYAFLARGRGGMWTIACRGHPLLVDAWLALPTFAAHPDVHLESLEGWRADCAGFVRSFRARLGRMAPACFAARAASISLTMVLAVTVCRWGCEIGGPWTGTLTLGMFTFDPTLLAHGGLATNDAGVTALGTLSLYLVWRWMRRRSWYRAALSGLLLGLTMLTKASGVIWGASAMVMTLPLIWRRRQVGVQVLAALTVAALTVWAAYGFSWGKVDAFPLPVPAPAHWEALLFHLRRSAERLVFALGRLRAGRWWWYFVLAFLIKNPLPLLFGWGAGIAATLHRREKCMALYLHPLLYSAVALWKGPNIGYRHMLPVHPFLHVSAAVGLLTWARERRGRAWRLALLSFLGTWYVVGTLRVFPYEISFFNELVGGPDGGYRYLVDSNLSWGQCSHLLRDYLKKHPDVRGTPPDATFCPPAGRYVVSASHLQGIGIDDPYSYEWFRHRRPSQIIAHSLLVYDVPPFAPRWFAQCSAPRTPLPADVIAAGTGYDDLRLVEFDCSQSWLYPDGGREEGIYALNRRLLRPGDRPLLSLFPPSPVAADPFIARRLAPARLSFTRERGERTPPFALYEWPAVTVGGPAVQTVYALSAGMLPADLGPAQAHDLPVTLDGPLAFLGAVAHCEGGGVEVETWWRATGGQVTRPFSIMGQLLGKEGQVLAAEDGLGISPLALAAGDVLVQRHRFASPSGEGLWLRTGVYWRDTMTRWPLSNNRLADLLLVPLKCSP